MHSKTQTKITPLDAILILGLMLVFCGFIIGGINYLYYTGGRPERFVNSRVGAYHILAKPAGDTRYKEAAIIGATGAAAGFILSAFSLITKLVLKKVKPAEG
ncbi:MAG: hypothetical protein WC476_00285 [Phycisphaerae bacterium]